MSDTIIQTVELPPPPPPSKFDREYRAFLRLLPELLKTHRGKCVAIHEERVVAEGDDVIQVALEAYRRHGYVPTYVSPVISPPVETVRMTRYRLVPPEVPS
jgi:hypothetical protein